MKQKQTINITNYHKIVDLDYKLDDNQVKLNDHKAIVDLNYKLDENEIKQ